MQYSLLRIATAMFVGFGFVGLVWIAVCEFLRRALVGLVSGAAVGLGFELCGSGFWTVGCLVWAIWVLGLVCGLWFAGFGWIVAFAVVMGLVGLALGFGFAVVTWWWVLVVWVVVWGGFRGCGLGWIFGISSF